MATDKKLYINKDTEFAEGISITQGGKPIGGGEVSYKCNKNTTLAELYAQCGEKYANVEYLASATSTFPSYIGSLFIHKESENPNKYSITGSWFAANAPNGDKALTNKFIGKSVGYSDKNGDHDLEDTTLCSVLILCFVAPQSTVTYSLAIENKYGHNLSMHVPDSVNKYCLAVGLPRSNSDDQNYQVVPINMFTEKTDPSDLLNLYFDDNGGSKVLAGNATWITPKVVYNDIQRSQAQVENDCELKNQNIIFELNYEEIVNRVLQYQDDLQFNGYIMSKYFHDEWVDIDGYTDYNKGNPEINFIVNLKGSTVSNEFTLFTYDQSSGSFTYRDKSLNRFEIVSSLGSIYEKVSIAHGILPTDVKFYTQIVTNSVSEQMNANHEFDITNMIKHVPSGTTLYKHELMGSINGSYGSGDVDIISGYIISTDSAPLSDITSLYSMLGFAGTCISIRLQCYDYSSADTINIDRLIPGSTNSWLALSGVNYSAAQVHIQLELPTCSLVDTVTEL